MKNNQFPDGVKAEHIAFTPFLFSKENKNTDDEYSYTYTFDMNKIDEKVAAEFNAYKDVVSQNDYFENYDYECEVQ